MDMTLLFEACMALLATVITVVIVPYINAKTTDAEQVVIGQWISVAVAAAEQLADTGLIDDKLAYAEAYLETLGVCVSREEIESAVYWLNNALTQGLTTEDGV